MQAWPALKRVGDVVLASAGLVALAPLLVVVSIAVAITSKGGVLFVQPRVGRDEEWFTLIKFRTMVADASERQAELEHLNELDGAVFAIRHDPRVTAVGRFLRRTSLDELPQLVNVVKGEMSLVGPRPLPERDHSLLDEDSKVRYLVKPGMTGLAQVSGRNELSFEEMMAFDALYAKTCSARLDLSILLRTPTVMVTGRGAY